MKRIIFILLLFTSLLTSGQGNFFWSHNVPATKYGILYNWWATQPQTSIKYGALYNFYAATDARKITSSDDWKVPTNTELVTLRTYIAAQANNYDGTTTLGTNSNNKQAMAVASVYEDWFSSGTIGALGNNTSNDKRNITGFNARPSGFRDSNYGGINTDFVMFTSVEFGTEAYTMSLGNSYTSFMILNGYPKFYGASLRLLYTGAGTPTTYTGNDGKVYKCVQIGTQIWLSESLCETKYRNGDWIHGFDGGVYTPIAGAAWAALTTEGMCYYEDSEANVIANNSIAPTGWHVPTWAEWTTLRDYVGSSNSGVLKATGYDYWLSPNTGATNTTGFSARGAGIRVYNTGDFGGAKAYTEIWSSTQYDATGAYISSLWANSTIFQTHGQSNKAYGRSIRLIKDDDTWSAGMTVTDQDGNIYQTVKIGNQVWITENWKCTKWADGTAIENITDNTTWINAVAPAWCYYRNDLKYK